MQNAELLSCNLLSFPDSLLHCMSTSQDSLPPAHVTLVHFCAFGVLFPLLSVASPLPTCGNLPSLSLRPCIEEGYCLVLFLPTQKRCFHPSLTVAV